nr:farnesyl pyrophosphate synthase-like isoform X1 [Leptinotarsa decemlineata]
MNCMRQIRFLRIHINGVRQIEKSCRIIGYENYACYSTMKYFETKAMKTGKSKFSMENIPRASSSSIVNPFSASENEEFMKYFPEIVEVLTKVPPCENQELVKQLTTTATYNLDLGTKARGIATVVAYKALKKHDLTPENIKLAVILGWCVRMVESFVLMFDDIVDNSWTRGGKLCWFRKNNVGMRAIIDGVYLENGVYYILKKYFSTHPQYVNLLEHFLESNFTTFIGQSLDMMPRNLDDFTLGNYITLTIGKTVHLAMYTSVAAAMFLANISDKEIHHQVKSLLSSMGTYCQIQNDFLDIYGNPEETGKIGTDIREGKFSWLAIRTLEKASDRQKILMKENYGKDNDNSYQIIRNLYDEMNLKEEYKRYKEQTYIDIQHRISLLPVCLPHDLFYRFLDLVYNDKWSF